MLTETSETGQGRSQAVTLNHWSTGNCLERKTSIPVVKLNTLQVCKRKKDLVNNINVVTNLKCSKKLCPFVAQNQNFERKSNWLLHYD